MDGVESVGGEKGWVLLLRHSVSAGSSPSSSTGTDAAQKLSGCCICLMSVHRIWDRLEFMHCESWHRIIEFVCV